MPAAETLGAPLGVLLATTPVGTIVEWFDVSDGQADAWHQAQFGNDRRIQHRSWSARFGWSSWAHVDVSCDLRYPARQVPPDQADADPSRRLPSDATPSGTPDQITRRWHALVLDRADAIDEAFYSARLEHLKRRLNARTGLTPAADPIVSVSDVDDS